MIRAIATGYEIQVNLATAVDLHDHGIDQVEHLGPSITAGLAALLGSRPVTGRSAG